MKIVKPVQCPKAYKGNLIYLFHLCSSHVPQQTFYLFIWIDFMSQRRSLGTSKTIQHRSYVILVMITWPFI